MNKEAFLQRIDKRGLVNERRPHLGRCWEWQGAKSSGYRMAWFLGKLRHAHRIMWFITYGVWPERQLNHKCLNRACVRLSHLEEATIRENLFDSPNTQASINAAKTHCPQGHEYTLENTLRYKRSDYVGEYRRCRTCANAKARARRSAA